MGTSSNRSTPPKRSPISVGIGGWTDKEYKGLLYPKGLPDNQRLTTYATWFDHVEVNMGYHRIPPVKFVENWVTQTPANFVFDFKLHKNFSTNPEGAARGGKLVPQVLRAARPLGESRELAEALRERGSPGSNAVTQFRWPWVR